MLLPWNYYLSAQKSKAALQPSKKPASLGRIWPKRRPASLIAYYQDWWARLPLPTARTVLFASVVDDPSSHPEKFPTEETQNAERERLFDIVRKLMQKKLHERPDVYAKAREEMLKHADGKLPPALDPFAGGGSIPLEAARLGFEACGRGRCRCREPQRRRRRWRCPGEFRGSARSREHGLGQFIFRSNSSSKAGIP